MSKQMRVLAKYSGAFGAYSVFAYWQLMLLATISDLHQRGIPSPQLGEIIPDWIGIYLCFLPLPYPYAFLGVLLWPAVTVALDEFLLRRRRKEFSRAMRFALWGSVSSAVFAGYYLSVADHVFWTMEPEQWSSSAAYATACAHMPGLVKITSWPMIDWFSHGGGLWFLYAYSLLWGFLSFALTFYALRPLALTMWRRREVATNRVPT